MQHMNLGRRRDDATGDLPPIDPTLLDRTLLDRTPASDMVEAMANAQAARALAAPGYERLAAVLRDAFEHATGRGPQPFEHQSEQALAMLYGPAYPLGKVAAKAQSALRPHLPPAAATGLLLDAIVDLAAAVIALEQPHRVRA